MRTMTTAHTHAYANSHAPTHPSQHLVFLYVSATVKRRSNKQYRSASVEGRGAMLEARRSQRRRRDRHRAQALLLLALRARGHGLVQVRGRRRDPLAPRRKAPRAVRAGASPAAGSNGQSAPHSASSTVWPIRWADLRRASRERTAALVAAHSHHRRKRQPTYGPGAPDAQRRRRTG